MLVEHLPPPSPVGDSLGTPSTFGAGLIDLLFNGKLVTTYATGEPSNGNGQAGETRWNTNPMTDRDMQTP